MDFVLSHVPHLRLLVRDDSRLASALRILRLRVSFRFHSRLGIRHGGLVLGLAFGSFLNVCIARLPAHQSIVTPASHCRTLQRADPRARQYSR